MGATPSSPPAASNRDVGVAPTGGSQEPEDLAEALFNRMGVFDSEDTGHEALHC